MNQSTSTNAGQSGINESQPPASSGHGLDRQGRGTSSAADSTPTPTARLLQYNRRVGALAFAAAVGNDAEVSRLLDDPRAEPVLDSVLDAAVREATAAGIDDLGDEMGTLERPDRFETV
jgi:hypothetical protein